jgi:hypothetical protein
MDTLQSPKTAPWVYFSSATQSLTPGEEPDNVFCSHRAQKEYWQNLRIASGRPYNPSMSKPDAWGVTKGTAELMQQKEATTEQQLRELFEKQKFKSAQ